MCLIVDANVAAKFFCGSDHHTKDLRDAVFVRGCCVVYGGKLLDEYKRIEKALRVVLALDRAGKARAISDAPIKERTLALEQSGILASDDSHVIALAQVSNSRLLHSEDELLHQDFTNPNLISSPRGKVYQGGTKHRHLVQSHCERC